jgi:hypothetical protein
MDLQPTFADIGMSEPLVIITNSAHVWGDTEGVELRRLDAGRPGDANKANDSSPGADPDDARRVTRALPFSH